MLHMCCQIDGAVFFRGFCFICLRVCFPKLQCTELSEPPAYSMHVNIHTCCSWRQRDESEEGGNGSSHVTAVQYPFGITYILDDSAPRGPCPVPTQDVACAVRSETEKQGWGSAIWTSCERGLVDSLKLLLSNYSIEKRGASILLRVGPGKLLLDDKQNKLRNS